MRALLIAAIAIGLGTLILAERSTAQQTGRTVQRVIPLMQAPGPPDTRFRSRTVEERVAAARRLAARQPGIRVPMIQIGESFVLTPRYPYAPHRGVLSGSFVDSFEPRKGDSGYMFFLGGWAGGHIELALTVNPPAKLLVECTVWNPGGTGFAATFRLTESGPIFSSQTSSVYNGVVSYSTPMISNAPGNTVFVRIRPEPNNNGDQLMWSVVGCEVTRITE